MVGLTLDNKFTGLFSSLMPLPQGNQDPEEPKSAGVLLVQDNLVLAVSFKNNPLRWGLPFGGREPGESLIDTARRELLEETGVDLRYIASNMEILQHLYTGVARSGLASTYYAPGLSRTFLQGLRLRPSEEGTPCWVPWTDLFAGPYGAYNHELYLRYLAAQ